MRVLGVDPGLTRCGLGVVDGLPGHRVRMVWFDVARSSAEADVDQRLLAIERRWRGPYQSLFEQRRVRKTYRALAPWQESLETPVVVRDHLRKDRGALRAEVVPDAPVNAETLVEMEERRADLAVYRLSPRTGRTHQLRVHLAGLGSPIVNDPLYPTVADVSVATRFSHIFEPPVPTRPLISQRSL